MSRSKEETIDTKAIDEKALNHFKSFIEKRSWGQVFE